jgi:alkaline phosphatase D
VGGAHRGRRDDHRLSRRTLLGGAAATALVGVAWSQGEPGATAVPGPSRWLGPDFWGNRMQDWIRRNGRIECAAGAGNGLVRTVGVLTRSLTGAPAEVRIRTGTLQAGRGYSGFLIGTGTPDAHPLSAALVMSASGEGGGIFCVYDTDGQVRFRDHTDEDAPFAYAKLPFTQTGPAPDRRLDEDVDLVLNITAGATVGRVRLRLRAINHTTGRLLSEATMVGVDTSRVVGGISFVSSDRAGSGARFWFRSLQTSGSGVSAHPGRALGPIVGTLFSRFGARLRMTVQLMPHASLRGAPITLQVKDATGRWRDRASATVGDGYTALLTAGNWPSTSATPYRVVTPTGATWSGVVPAEPNNGFVVASVNCVKATHRPTDRDSSGEALLAGAQPLGLYSGANVYFPFHQLVAGVQAHQPDLLTVHGDQYYESSPTARTQPTELELLYKYIPWLWSFREITRNTPTVVLVDDHDVYQPNLWGAGGDEAPGGDIREGGYTSPADFVNLVQRVQCGHNPPPFDPTPVGQGIGVYYTTFAYGGISWALIEDRKFKTGPDSDEADTNPQLLGARQEDFLATWPTRHPGLPRIMLSQTTYACAHTDETGTPIQDHDSNGWPPQARNRALRLIKNAGAIMLAGDQHLGTLIRHGIDSFDDGPIQFTAPAGSTSFQRWFEPAGDLPQAGDTPHTGHWTDGFGNQLHSLAVINPSFTQAEFRTIYPDRNDFGDRNLKNEGYGIVRIDPTARRFTFECWRWNSNQSDTQYPGWPYQLSFDDI